MPTPVALEALSELEFIPQAIVDQPLSFFANKWKLEIVHGHDDLDEFDGAALRMHNGTLIELKHPSGYPPNTTVIYFSYEIRDVGRITDLIFEVADELGFPSSWISWKRSDNPDL